MQIQRIKQQVKQFANKRKKIAAVHIFGSRATGKKQPHSDLDLAIMSTNSISAEKRITWEIELSEATGIDVDLVIFKQEVRSRADYLDTRHLYKKIAV